MHALVICKNTAFKFFFFRSHAKILIFEVSNLELFARY